MRTRHRRQSNRGRWVVPLIAAAFLSYFGFHAVNGDLGLNARLRLEQRHAQLKVEHDKLVAERKAMERRASLLKDGTIDKDMLDEQARALLEVARPDDIVIYR
ncbi:MAG TPA: septum formation initiator family protein [Pararhizobium sp.]|nr:septum formation initiator family protein [Pararhizobium sp.]